MTHEPETPSAVPNETPLQGWKEIAAYLKRDVRTARRWELEEALPVRRHRTDRRSSVYSYASEIEAWRAARAVKDAPEPERPWLRRLAPFGAAAALAVTAWLIVRGPILNPDSPLVEAADPGGVTARRVWYGDRTDMFGTLSPDGKRMTFNDWATMNVAIHDFDTGEDIALLEPAPWSDGNSAMFPIFSPDGNEVAYSWFDEKNPNRNEIRIVSADGKNVRTVYGNSEMDALTPLAWFPGGDKLLLRTVSRDKTMQLALLSLETSSLRTLISMGWQKGSNEGKVALSPDGRWVAYSLDQEVYVMAADGSEQSAVAPGPAKDSVIFWTSDGNSLLFISDRSGGNALWSISVKEGKPEGSPRMLKAEFDTGWPVGMTAQGALYYGVRSGLQQIVIGAWDIESGQVIASPKEALRSFVGPQTSPAWSPDGRSIAFFERYNQLWIENLETGKLQKIGPELGFSRGTELSLDGKSIALLSYGDNRGHGVYIADAESGEMQLVIKSTEEWRAFKPRWSADGKAIYYQQQVEDQGEGRIVRFDLETQQEKLIAENSNCVAVSRRDGRLALCMELEDGGEGLFVADSEGGNLRQLCIVATKERKASRATYPVWTGDGRFIVLWRPSEAGTARELVRVSAESGEVVQLPVKLEGGNNTHISIHPDGKRIAIPVNTTSQEVWALENFLPTSASD